MEIYYCQIRTKQRSSAKAQRRPPKLREWLWDAPAGPQVGPLPLWGRVLSLEHVSSASVLAQPPASRGQGPGPGPGSHVPTCNLSARAQKRGSVGESKQAAARLFSPKTYTAPATQVKRFRPRTLRQELDPEKPSGREGEELLKWITQQLRAQIRGVGVQRRLSPSRAELLKFL